VFVANSKNIFLYVYNFEHSFVLLLHVFSYFFCMVFYTLAANGRTIYMQYVEHRAHPLNVTTLKVVLLFREGMLKLMKYLIFRLCKQ